jgi:hypothetical protein
VKNGETPSDERLIALIKPLIPEITVDEASIVKKAVKALEPMIPREETAKSLSVKLGTVKEKWLPIEAIKGDFSKFFSVGRNFIQSLRYLTDVDLTGVPQDEKGNFMLGQITPETYKVKYDANDPTAGYIADKFKAGTGISLAEGTGADENKLIITNDAPAPAETDPLSIHLNGDNSPTAEIDWGNQNLINVKKSIVGTNADDGYETPSQVKGSIENYPCPDPSNLSVTGSPEYYEYYVYYPSLNSSSFNFTTGTFNNPTLDVTVYSYGYANDSTYVDSSSIYLGQFTDSSSTDCSLDIVINDSGTSGSGGGTSGYIVEVFDGSNYYYTDIGNNTSFSLTDPTFSGWNTGNYYSDYSGFYYRYVTTGNLTYSNDY